jgi:hypothetical protein
MPGEYYNIDSLTADKQVFQSQINANTQAIEDLTEQNTQLTANVTQIDALLDVISANYPTIPALTATSNFVPTQTDSTTVSLTWFTITNAAGYIVEQSINADFSNSTEIYNSTGTTTTATDLEPGVTYFFRVKGYADGYVDSDWFPISVIVYNQLDQPAGFDVTPDVTGSIIGHWGDSLGAQSYDYYRGTTNVFGSAALIANVVIPTFTDTGLMTGTSYYYWIVAKAANYLDSDPEQAATFPAVAP